MQVNLFIRIDDMIDLSFLENPNDIEGSKEEILRGFVSLRAEKFREALDTIINTSIEETIDLTASIAQLVTIFSYTILEDKLSELFTDNNDWVHAHQEIEGNDFYRAILHFSLVMQAEIDSGRLEFQKPITVLKILQDLRQSILESILQNNSDYQEELGYQQVMSTFKPNDLNPDVLQSIIEDSSTTQMKIINDIENSGHPVLQIFDPIIRALHLRVGGEG